MTNTQSRLHTVVAVWLSLMCGLHAISAHADKKEDLLVLLKSEGFESPTRIIEKHPRILEISLDEIQLKLDWLRSLGVTHLDRVLSTLPSALNYSLEGNLKPKVILLRRAGFQNIGLLIERFAPILGLDVEYNVLPKIEFFTREWALPFSYLETAPVLLGMSFSRMKETTELLSNLGLPFQSLKSPEKRNILQKWNPNSVLLRLYLNRLLYQKLLNVEKLTRVQLQEAQRQIAKNPTANLRLLLKTPKCALVLTAVPSEVL